MDGTALVLCGTDFRTDNGKTAHGLVRGTERYRVVGVVDSSCPGEDAGRLLDGVSRGIPVFASIPDALARLPDRPDFAVVGIATSGGRIPPELKAAIAEAIDSGLSIVNGLHELVSDDPALAEAAAAQGLDHRRAPAAAGLRAPLLDGRDPRRRGRRGSRSSERTAPSESARPRGCSPRRAGARGCAPR